MAGGANYTDPDFRDKVAAKTAELARAEMGNAANYKYLPYEDAHYAFFGFSLKAVENLTLTAHGGLYNLGAFDEFGYGRFAEFIKYTLPVGNGLGVGITMQQEFYGGDVFIDEVTNSPFLQFTPEVSYVLIPMPGVPMPLLNATLPVTVGLAKDVLDIYVKAKPTLTLSLGTLFMDLFYELEYTGYVEATNIKPLTRHTAGLALMLLF
jgi:hypothetical protein